MISTITSEKAIEVLRSLFARHRLPEQLLSDNVPQFISAEFKKFIEGNRIKHIMSAPHHPASNCLTESFVQTLKRTLKDSPNDSKSIHHSLAQFLFEHCETTNVASSELFLKRKLRTCFVLMMPNTKQHVKQADQKQHHDKRAKSQPMFPGTTVLVREYNRPNKWIPGVILQKLGPVTFSIAINNGRTVNRHIDQLRYKTETVDTFDVTPSDSVDADIDTYPYSPSENTTVSQTSTTERDTLSQVIAEPSSRHYQLRQCKPLDCLTPSFDGQSHSGLREKMWFCRL